MDDFNKIFGIGLHEKLLSASNSIESIAALSNPLKYSNWMVRSEENLAMKAITGNSLQLWEAILKMPKLPENNVLAAITGNNWMGYLSKPNPALDSLTSLSSKMSWLSSAANYSNFIQPNNWSKSLLASTSAIEMLSKSIRASTWNNSNIGWSSLVEQQPVKEKKGRIKEETVIAKIERFASNVTAVYSEVENLDEPQQIKFASNIAEVLTYEVQSTKDLPTYIPVLEWILHKYNMAIESAIVARNIEALKNIHAQLKAITIVGWLAIIISTAALGVVESQGGKLWDNITSAKADNNSTITYNTVVTYNASTNSPRPLRIEPDGRTKIVCIIPDCTEVQLGEVVGKYIQVSFLNNGSVERGWCLNKEFVKLVQPH